MQSEGGGEGRGRTMFRALAVEDQFGYSTACQGSSGSSLGEGHGEPLAGPVGFGRMFPSAPLPADRAQRSDAEINVVIALERPCKILQASPEWLAEFDFSSDEALGRTLGLIQGPKTERSCIVSLFENARWGKAAEVAVTFYSRHGHGTLYNVRARCVAVPTGGEPSALIMSFIKCEAVSWKKATEEDGLAKALVEVTAPCRTVNVSSEFADLYDLLPQELLGRTLNIIQGPSTDRSKWASLLHAGQRGISSRAVISTSARHCREIRTEIAVYPVIGSDGCFAHLLFVFSDIDNIPALPSSSGPPGGENQVEARPMSHKWDARRIQYSHGLHRDFTDGYPSTRDASVMSGMVGRPPHMTPGVDPSQLSMPLVRRMQLAGHPSMQVHDYLATPHHEYEPRGLGVELQNALRRPPMDMAEFDGGLSFAARRPHPELHLPGARLGVSTFENVARRGAPHSDAVGMEYPVHDPREDPAHLKDLEIGHSSVPVDMYPEAEGCELVHMAAGPAVYPAMPSQLTAAARADMRSLPHAETMRTVAVAASAEPQMASLVHMGYGSEIGTAPQQQKEDVVSTIIPRRKKKEGIGVPAKNLAKPVKIALDLLEQLSCLSLSQAADTLGISSTAMKKSCRKLGVTRWPYRSDQPSGGQCHIDDAYVRKIQRKYAASVKKGSCGAAMSLLRHGAARGAAAGVGQPGDQPEQFD